MATSSIGLSKPLNQYLQEVSIRETNVQKRLRQETYTMSARECQMAPEQAQFMALMVKLLGAKRALEIGVFTGYSALAVALALPADGKLIACDVSADWTSIAQRYWQEAGVAGKIDLRLAPALNTLGELVADPDQHGAFDFAFIDADKNNNENYYELCLQLVRPGGLIMIDNVLWAGELLDPDRQDKSTNLIRKLNKKLHADDRVDISVVPIGDGMTLARKR
jgi:caffeoyl-CoA O-methyltransferase